MRLNTTTYSSNSGVRFHRRSYSYLKCRICERMPFMSEDTMDSQQLAYGTGLNGPSAHRVTDSVRSYCPSKSSMPIFFAYPFSTCLQVQNSSERLPLYSSQLMPRSTRIRWLLISIPDRFGQPVSLPLLDERIPPRDWHECTSVRVMFDHRRPLGPPTSGSFNCLPSVHSVDSVPV